MYKLIIKRSLDLLFSIFLLPFLGMVFLPVAVYIKREDGGPIFYRSKRIGRNGKCFKMYKFRSMKVNAEDIRLEDGSTYNADDDQRVTKVGKFIRETSIDELPQIINIVLGNMSFIGPRPDLNIDEKFENEYKNILKVRPGITGYTQAYFRNEIKWIEKVKYDTYYANNVSLVLDCKILIKTFFTVIKRDKTYRKVN